MMNEFISLLENFWIIRDGNNSEYYKIKRAVNNDLKHFLNDFPGWKLIINNKLIKLEKKPAEAAPFMGIQDFQSPTDYCLLCALLIYLNDIDDGRQFLLTELIEAIEKIVSDTIDVNFTKYSDRKALVRMLGFAQKEGMLKVSEGSLTNVENDLNKEILYENTGISGYFSLHHDRDFSANDTYHDFENQESVYTDSEKGSARTNRVYRRLILQPAMYWVSNDDMDSIYLKNQRASVIKYLDEYLNGRLDIHNGSAFCMLNEDSPFGDVHPTDKMISGLILLICYELRDRLFSFQIRSDKNQYEMEKDKMYNLICECREKYRAGLSKEYREIADNKLTENIINYMLAWKMLELNDENTFLLRDGIFKTCGKYPKDFDYANSEISNKEDND
ncbi:MAG: TIGR02678 family protein [Oscillospiraceae bacterium]